MDMDIVFFEEMLVDLLLSTHGTDVADPGSCRLFHHISHLSRQQDLSLSRHDVHFDLQGIPAYAGPGKPADDPDLIRLVRHLVDI